jgi:hypothetical protein
MLSLAAVAAIAAMAFIGVGTASATTLCSVNTNPCPEGSRYTSVPVEAALEAGTEAVLTGPVPVKCTTSTVKGKSEGTSGNPLTGHITGLTFGPTCSGCTEVEPLLPVGGYTVHVSAGATQGNGTMTVLGAEVHLRKCPLGTSCLATAKEVVLDVTGGNPAKVVAKEEPITLSCSLSSGSWTATYVVSTPKPVFVEKEP